MNFLFVWLRLFVFTLWCLSVGASPLIQKIRIGTNNTGYGGASYNNLVNVLDYTIPLSRYGFIASQESSIVFGVKACQDAFVYLSSSSAMDSKKDFYEIVFGAGGGRSLFFRRNVQHIGYVPNVTINCSTFSFFWISWEKGNISIGRGEDMNVDIIYNWIDPAPWPINGIGVRTYSSIGQWIIYHRVHASTLYQEIWIGTNNTGYGGASYNNLVNVLDCTIPLSRYGFIASQESSIVFGVKACQDAFVYLSSSSAMDSKKDFYEIVFGAGGGWSLFFRRNVQHIGYVPNVTINCSTFSFFWISWEKGNISIGRGEDVNVDKVYNWIDPAPWPINGIGVRTYSSIGQWIIYHRTTGSFCLVAGIRGNMTVMQSVVAERYSCALECFRELKCLGFNYNEQTMSCQLISTGETESLSSEQNWEYVVKCFIGECLGCLK